MLVNLADVTIVLLETNCKENYLIAADHIASLSNSGFCRIFAPFNRNGATGAQWKK